MSRGAAGCLAVRCPARRAWALPAIFTTALPVVFPAAVYVVPLAPLENPPTPLDPAELDPPLPPPLPPDPPLPCTDAGRYTLQMQKSALHRSSPAARPRLILDQRCSRRTKSWSKSVFDRV